MSAKHIIAPKVGFKEITIEQQPDDSWSASCWCSVFKQTVRFPISGAQATELLSADCRNIQEVLPDTPRQLREIFLTGATPAEFDKLMSGRAKPKENYTGLGYDYYQPEPVPDEDEDDWEDDPSRWDAEY